MENVQIVKETISSLNPVACGNSRSCYHVGDRVVLVETASSSTYEKALKAQEYTNLLQSKGVNTAKIENLFFDEGKLYWVEDKLMGHPVYFRNEKSFCLSKGLELPASEIKINSLDDLNLEKIVIESKDLQVCLIRSFVHIVCA